MERSLSKIRDVDLKILSELGDRDVLNYCKTHKYGNELCNNEDFWRNRLQLKYPGSEGLKSLRDTWKDFYLKIMYYFDKYKTPDKAMVEAVRKNDIEMVKFFILQGASKWGDGMDLASYLGNRKLVDFFIQNSKSAGEEWEEDDWNMWLAAAAEGGHIDLMKFFIAQGADGLNLAMYIAARGGNKQAVDYLISQGANHWLEGLRGAKDGRHKQLINFFENKLV